ncbi:MAG: family 20 glycosylhydrolase [Fibrobacterota bacterium]
MTRSKPLGATQQTRVHRLVGLLFLCALFAATVRVNAARPNTLPALQEWTDGTGGFVFSAASRIVLDNSYTGQLATTGAVFAADLLQLTQWTLPVVSAATPGTGDIFLSLSSSDTQLDSEGYSLSITDHAAINAQTDAGAFYGTRTLLQLLRQSYTLPAGTARDWPNYPERALMVDCGRKYFTVDWLRNKIIEIAYLKMNVFQLHVSDNLGFRLQSTVHPEITSAQHYTRAEIDTLHALAGKYHVMLIPEIDMPGHMNTILLNHPELRITAGDINLSLDTAYRFMSSIMEEFIPWFPAPYWHVGADEYRSADSSGMLEYAQAHYGPMAVAKDTYRGFVNWADSIVKSHGKTMRAWSDGLSNSVAVTINTDISYDMWAYGINPQQAINEGRTVVNSHSSYLYYVLGGYWKPNAQNLYEIFKPNQFSQGLIAANNPYNRGAKLNVWCDSPNAETETQIGTGIYIPMRILAQKNWDSPLSETMYYQFLPFIWAAGNAPGLLSPESPDTTNLALFKPTTASSLERPIYFSTNAVDGFSNTFWSSAFSDPQWLQVDLQDTFQVNRIKLKWGGIAYASAYQLQVATDINYWNTVYSTTTGNGDDSITFSPVAARYVRMYGTVRATQWGYSLREMAVYSDSGITTIVKSNNTLVNTDVQIHVTELVPGSFALGFVLPNKRDIRISMYTVRGQKVYGASLIGVKEGVKTITLNHPASGVYFCVVDIGDRILTRKLVIAM